MEITEKEREMLEKEREEIKKLTMEIIEMLNDPKNRIKIKQKVIGIQFSVNRMASYSNPKQNELDTCAEISRILLNQLDSNPSVEVQEGMNRLIYDPPEEILKRAGIKRDKYSPPRQNVAYPAWWGLVVTNLNSYCSYVNSIRFDFTKKGLRIVFPKVVLPKTFNLGIFFNK